MKQINSKAYNIDEDIVGRVTFGKRNLLRRSNDILVRKDINKPLFGYMATITENDSFYADEKPYCIVNDIKELNEGDVIVINKLGEIIFVYEIASNHNAIMTTERCNHRCIMCAQPPVLHEKDKTLFNLNLISLFDKNTQEIGITGGEPTLIGDNLFVLIKHIQKKLPKASVSILSNGVKFAEKEYAAKLALCHHNYLQVDIPLFSDIAQEHNRIVGAKTFYKTVQGLYNLAIFRQRIGIRIVIHKQTYKRLPQFADFIYHNFPFVSQVAFMQMEITGYAKDCKSSAKSLPLGSKFSLVFPQKHLNLQKGKHHAKETNQERKINQGSSSQHTTDLQCRTKDSYSNGGYTWRDEYRRTVPQIRHQ